MAVCSEGQDLLTVTESGYGRRSSFDDYRVQSRAGKGVTNYRTASYGEVAGITAISDDEDVIMISAGGIVIRIPADGISTFARPAKGVRVMRVGEGDKVVTLARSIHENEDEEDAEGEAGENAPENATEDASAEE